MSRAAYDVAILGGGPAGAAAALSLKRLRPGLRVRMVEASRYAEWRAGETLSPGTQQLLAGLGCWDRFLAERFTPAYGTRAAWGTAETYDNEFLFSARGDGFYDQALALEPLARGRDRAGVDVQAVDASTEEKKVAVLAGMDVVFCAAAAGRQILSKEVLSAGKSILLAADVNAVPPTGVEGLEMTANGVELNPRGTLGIGPLAIGSLKYKTEFGLFGKMIAADKPAIISR